MALVVVVVVGGGGGGGNGNTVVVVVYYRSCSNHIPIPTIAVSLGLKQQQANCLDINIKVLYSTCTASSIAVRYCIKSFKI